MPPELKYAPGEPPEEKKAKALRRSAWHAEHAWHPHQLRDSAATRLRKEYGLEAAQVILGHKTLSVTEIYAEKNVASAMRIMSAVGDIAVGGAQYRHRPSATLRRVLAPRVRRADAKVDQPRTTAPSRHRAGACDTR